MYAMVLLEGVDLRKTLGAFLTAIRFVTGVYPVMDVEVAGESEAFIAVRAFVGLLVRMHLVVEFQIVQRGVHLMAIQALVLL